MTSPRTWNRYRGTMTAMNARGLRGYDRIADPSGHALVLVESDKGVLKVKSGALVCEASYSLPERTNVQGYDQMKLVHQ